MEWNVIRIIVQVGASTAHEPFDVDAVPAVGTTIATNMRSRMTVRRIHHDLVNNVVYVYAD
jgi:hypothetical protein